MEVIKGNLITLAEEGVFSVIVQGCNCFCTMGAGLAKEIRKRYPEAYHVDCTTQKGDASKLGGYSYVKVTCERTGRKFYIVNAYTQFTYGSGITQSNYNAIRRAFNMIGKEFFLAKIGYPKIGAGLGGGDWNIIKKIIDYELRDNTHTLVEYDANVTKPFSFEEGRR